MLVLFKMDVNLREYLQQIHNQLTWKERIQIVVNIIDALGKFIMGKQFIEICILEIYYIHDLMIVGLLVILDFVDQQTNNQQTYMEIWLT